MTSTTRKSWYALLTCLLSLGSAFAADHYAIREIQTSLNVYAQINSRGQVGNGIHVTPRDDEPFRSHAGLIEVDGTVRDYGSLGPDGAGNMVNVYDMNERGDLVGTGIRVSVKRSGLFGPRTYPFAVINGRIRQLSPRNGIAYSINNRGQIVGYTFYRGAIRGFVYQVAKGKRKLLPNPRGFTAFIARAINDHGTIVGHATALSDRRRQVFVYKKGKFINLGRQAKYAWDINNDGTVIGAHRDNASFIKSATGPVVKYAEGGLAGITNAGVIWGVTHPRGPILLENGVKKYLNDLLINPNGLVLRYVEDMADNGLIVAKGTVQEADGSQIWKTVVLTPTQPRSLDMTAVTLRGVAQLAEGDALRVAGTAVAVDADGRWETVVPLPAEATVDVEAAILDSEGNVQVIRRLQIDEHQVPNSDG